MINFKGSIPALITPMREDLSLDEQSLAKFVQFQIDCGTHGLVPMGTTGESPTLSHDEHKRVIDICLEVNAGKLPVMAGTGSNSTMEAIELTKYAKKAGADCALVVVPYYNKPNQEGMYQHYKAIAKAVDIPICIYNIPGRTGVEMRPDTFKRLVDEMPNSIVAMKDATGRPDNTKIVLDRVGGDFISLCGDDGLMGEFAANGALGCISVSANVAPKQCADMHNALISGDLETFSAINAKLMALHNSLFVEPNPCGAKYAAAKLGYIATDKVRLPMVGLSDETKATIDNALTVAGLI